VLDPVRRKFSLPPKALTISAGAALVASVLIVLGGGVVRVTGSGLGCPTWPECTAGSLTTTHELGIHGLIEFGNRTITGILCLTVVAVLISALLQRNPDRHIIATAWAQLALVIVNAVAGGITVLVDLNPWMVALHFVAAMGLLTTTTWTWHRLRQAPDAEALPGKQRGMAFTITAIAAILVVAGTFTTGSGPHSGDSADVPRMGFDWTGITVVHGILGAAVLVLGIAHWISLSRARRGGVESIRAGLFVGSVVLQAAIGLVQSLTSLPTVLVILHVMCAALVWIGAVRLSLDATGARQD
jgi:cytochrome c oxidase assembly protein subunit 15